jgi:PEP-CTERM motif-containing protein
MNKSKSIMLAAATAVASLLGASAVPAHASPYTLTNGNTNVTIDPSNVDGMYNWSLNDSSASQIEQQSFWYRVGSSGSQTNIASIGTPTVTEMSTDGGSDNWLNATYTDVAQAFQLSVTYMVSGGQPGSGVSDISETVKVINTSSTNSLSYHLFDYANFTLAGKNSGESVSLSGDNTATVTSGANSSQTVVSGKASEYAVGNANPFSGSLLNSIENTSDLTLGGPTSITDVDAEWGFQWDFNLAPGASYLVTIDKQVSQVPEPSSSLALLGMGGLFFSRPRRRDEDPDPRTAQVAEA